MMVSVVILIKNFICHQTYFSMQLEAFDIHTHVVKLKL